MPAGAQAGGALAGAWFGFGSTTGLLALLTTIVGAAAGANLTLIALDVSWDRARRSRFVAAASPPASPRAVGTVQYE